ncbi:MAG: hypothetical protein EBU90_03995 [Proteobacteria bacterium]|nr:hypothetical protein [Pseudomonadota bacterium]NBP14232.1 hypothetical protein [bacterium]
MAYYADPVNLFPAYSTDTNTAAIFPVETLPSCSGNVNNLQDIKEVLFSLLTVVDDDYASLPAYSSGVNVQTKATNFSISSTITNPSNGTVKKTFTVSFTANAPAVSVADENAYNPD